MAAEIPNLPVCARLDLGDVRSGREVTRKCSQGAQHVSPLDTLGQASDQPQTLWPRCPTC